MIITSQGTTFNSLIRPEFFLNPRHQLKAHGIAGQIFETVYDLGIVIEEIIEERYRAKNYNVERFILKPK